jgi:thiol-disulfide isomerase/thioredoxin
MNISMPPAVLVLLASCALGSAALGQEAPAQPVPPAQPAEPAQIAEPAQVAAEAHAGPTLRVGMKAPKLEVAAWVRGEPISELKRGEVYVVEFWATWCGPCRVSIPHLSKLQAEYKGRATILGVSIWERTPGLEKVQHFVEQMGDQMSYHVAYAGDDEAPAGEEPQSKMHRTWMEAAGQSGIPTAFVVDKEGDIVWIGHPMDRLDEVLAEVVAGRWGKERGIAEAKREAEIMAMAQAAEESIERAMGEGKFEEALAHAQRVIDADPARFAGLSVFRFRTMLVDLNKTEAAYAYARDLTTGLLKDDAQALNELAWMILDDPAVKTRNVDVAMAAARRADELTKSEDASILDTLAEAYFQKGEFDKAVSTQERAVARAGHDPDMKAMLEERLGKFREAAKTPR